ncbi:putative CXXCH cytochrome family protein [Geothermobacter ehrlichii]|uniref:Putative CXXCH cytochrome family protein n=1 Tax=Geothermobacter ehrlichii TaxID=213224 RepID=A0A5D3WFV7_9BACT|nr:cytochrome c3 family protein [Geothermobacter ehrlichii]TYO95041.1 putative CXXCH cytochrome family protein [Geothermobacter ehrlichii]
MKRLLLSLLFAGMLLVGLVSSGGALEIVYPADGTSITRSNFVIVKAGTSPAIEGMIIELNGGRTDMIDVSSPEYKAAFGDFLILQPEFDPGENSIRVEAYAGGKKLAEAKARIWYQVDPLAPPPEGYRPFRMHTPQREALCASCHNMNPDKVELQVADATQNPCASCHKRRLNHKYVHGPAGVWRCAYCHDANGRSTRYAVRKDGDAGLCGECHAEQIRQFQSSPYVHGPVAAGLCSVCHDSHATDNPAQVLAPINDLCLACHDSVRGVPHVARGISGESHPLSGVPDPSRPGRDLSCTGCHDPHSGNSKYYFQNGIRSRFGLCGKCHRK